MSGHGYVTPNPDGAKARCGGPGMCAVCAAEEAAKAPDSAVLADAGVAPEDYELIQQARRRIDEVNTRLQQRGAQLVFAVTMASAVPRSEWPASTPPGEVLEG